MSGEHFLPVSTTLSANYSVEPSFSPVSMTPVNTDKEEPEEERGTHKIMLQVTRGTRTGGPVGTSSMLVCDG